MLSGSFVSGNFEDSSDMDNCNTLAIGYNLVDGTAIASDDDGGDGDVLEKIVSWEPAGWQNHKSPHIE